MLCVLLRRPGWTSTSEMFVSAGNNTLQATLHKMMHSFICRLNTSDNVVIVLLVNIGCSVTISLGCGSTGTAVSSKGHFNWFVYLFCVFLYLCSYGVCICLEKS